MIYKQQLKADIAEQMRRLCNRKLTTVLGGNISCRTDEGMLITPSGIDKHILTEADIIEIDLKGNILHGKHNPSIEYKMHSNIYESRSDVNAIFHTHSFFLTLFSIIDKEINVKITAESAKNLGIVGIADYATMGSEELAEAVAQKARSHNIILMKNHGVVVVGDDLLNAFYRLEVAEQVAKLTYYSFGHTTTIISPQDVITYLG